MTTLALKHLEVQQSEKATVLKPLTRRLIDNGLILEMKDELLQFADDPTVGNIIVDFRVVETPAAFAMSGFIMLGKRLKKIDKKLIICNLQPQVHEAFEKTRLQEYFVTKGTLEEALAEF